MQVSIRKFLKSDIEKKIKWINDPDNNRYLHYDLPLVYEKTVCWYNGIKDRTDRYDAIIEVNGVPVGLVGLLCIEAKNRKAELYIALGEGEYKGKGVAKKATMLLLEYAFDNLLLNKVYLYTERENISAQRLFESSGFEREGLLKEDLIYNGRKVDRYFYGITAGKYYSLSNTHPKNQPEYE